VSVFLDNLPSIPDQCLVELLNAMQDADQDRGYMEPISQSSIGRFRHIFQDINQALSGSNQRPLPLDDDGILGEVRSYNMYVIKKHIH